MLCRKVELLLFFYTFFSLESANCLDCTNGLKRFVEDSITIDLSVFKGCSIIVETKPDGILAFRPLNNFSISETLTFLTIKDGLTRDFRFINAEDQILNPKVRQSEQAMKTIYTKKNIAIIGVGDAVPEGFVLKISKAVECPFNIGSESQCGRVVDPESCYCATFTKRTWQSQREFCLSKGFRFLALESLEEETAIHVAWGVDTAFWMSLNDIASEGVWVWESLGSRLYPGYANWNDGEPNDGITSDNEDCGELTTIGRYGWNDEDCSLLKDGLCERHPLN